MCVLVQGRGGCGAGTCMHKESLTGYTSACRMARSMHHWQDLHTYARVSVSAWP